MMRLIFPLVLVFLTLLVFPLYTRAGTWLVKPDGSGDAPTIQAAVHSASDGDLILLSNGVFTGDGNRNISINSKHLKIKSQSADPESCVIDCEGTAQTPRYGFELYNYHPLGIVMEGFTISNCYSGSRGGAINWPAGAYSLTVTNCMFTGNTAYRGAAIDVGMSGAGTLILTDCDFSGNSSVQEGGAVFVDELGRMEVTGCSFVGNNGVSGGGICVRETTNATISFCTFRDNHATGGGGYGGGIAFKVDSAGLVSHCVFFRNNALWGGGVECHDSSPTIENCTFYLNQGSGGGGGVRSYAFFGVAEVTISKTIIANSAGGGAVRCAGTGIATLDNSDLHSNLGGDWVNCVSGQLGIYGNIMQNPLFCGAPVQDFTLHEYSPCLPQNNPNGVLIGAFRQGCPDPTGIGDDVPTPKAPNGLRVYPSPFNPAATIEYSLAATGPVRLAIYNVRGGLVALLVDRVQPKGERATRWRGRDTNGAEVPSGVYFVRLEAAGQVVTRKIVLLR